MKQIQLTQGKFTLVDDEDYEYLNQFKWHTKPHRNTFYAVRTEYIKSGGGKKKHIKMHRVLLNLTDPSVFADHKDGDGLNNQKSNLRKCNNTENQRNRRSRKNSTSKYLGVYLATKENKFKSMIRINDKNTHLGTFEKSDEGEMLAAKAYDLKAREYFGEFANLNFK